MLAIVRYEAVQNRAGLELRLVLCSPRKQTRMRNGIKETVINAIRRHASTRCNGLRFPHGPSTRFSLTSAFGVALILRGYVSHFSWRLLGSLVSNKQKICPIFDHHRKP